jgi:hypothetical protein
LGFEGAKLKEKKNGGKNLKGKKFKSKILNFFYFKKYIYFFKKNFGAWAPKVGARDSGSKSMCFNC